MGSNVTIAFIALWVCLFALITWVSSNVMHEPPSRASAWRRGLSDFTYYDDNSCNCGGKEVQHTMYDGKCGACGEAWDSEPKELERNRDLGVYWQPLRYYWSNQVFNASFEIMAWQGGHVEFRICKEDPYTLPSKLSKSCFDNHIIHKVGGGYVIPVFGPGLYVVKLELPYQLTCHHCVLQWRYKTGKDWGCDRDWDWTSCCVGCGKQEEYYSCADIAIYDDFNSKSVMKYSIDDLTGEGKTSSVEEGEVTNPCVPAVAYASTPGIKEWCLNNCSPTPPHNCPSQICDCTSGASGGRNVYYVN